MDALVIANRVAASLAPPDTISGLHDLERLAPRIGLAEIRLDLMPAFDIEKLVAGSPVPLILTCRPARERGGYTGSERDRLAVLRTAYESGCAYIDVEADSLDSVAGWHGSATQIIASQHWFDHMPADLRDTYLELRDRCTVVKLVEPRVRPRTCFRCSSFCVTPLRRSSAWPWAAQERAPASCPRLSAIAC